jgi:hypothetical protein
MTTPVVLTIAGVLLVWISTVVLAYSTGHQAGRNQALSDAFSGAAWLTRGRNTGTKIEQVSRAVALARSALDDGEPIVDPGVPSESSRLIAHAAVVAMRVPTPEMEDAVRPFMRDGWSHPFFAFYDVMVEAALNPNPSPDRARGVTPEGKEAIRRMLLPFSNPEGLH